MNATQLIEVLQTAREDKGITRYQLAKKTGLAQPAIAKIEQNGGAQLRSIVSIADALGLELILKPNVSAKISSNLKTDTDAY